MTKINELIKKIEAAERLAVHKYKREDGCMCAVGHVFEDCGVLDKILEDQYNNSKHVTYLTEDVPNDIWNEVYHNYGLTIENLEDLQSINDSEEDPVKRKQHVIQFLRSAGEIVG